MITIIRNLLSRTFVYNTEFLAVDIGTFLLQHIEIRTLGRKAFFILEVNFGLLKSSSKYFKVLYYILTLSFSMVSIDTIF